jgi:hypothetical protein
MFSLMFSLQLRGGSKHTVEGSAAAHLQYPVCIDLRDIDLRRQWLVGGDHCVLLHGWQQPWLQAVHLACAIDVTLVACMGVAIPLCMHLKGWGSYVSGCY